jgi:hypothetical protein
MFSFQLHSGLVPFHELSEMRAVLPILSGERPSRPYRGGPCVVGPSDTHWDMITHCWQSEPSARLTMMDIHHLLGGPLESTETASNADQQTLHPNHESVFTPIISHVH